MEAPTFFSNRKPPPPSSSKTSTYGASYGGDGYFPTSYDDVFGGPPKFTAVTSTLAPRAEDYSEIFSGFRTSSSSRASSSIPVLDLPAINAAEFDDALDYSDVFGGIFNVDFALPFDQLFRSSDGFDASDDDDAWTPIGTESLSDDSDPFAFSEKSQSFFNGNSNQPLDSEGKQYNVSYHQVNPGTSTCIPDIMHVAQHIDVPVYTCVVEDATSLKGMDEERISSQAAEDIVINMKASPITTQKHVKETTPLKQEGAGVKSFGSEPKSGRTRNESSHVNSISTSDADLPKPSHSIPQTNSKPPSIPAERRRGMNGSSSGPKASASWGFEAPVDSSLPPFYDMEVDANSSAAVSAAAMKDVMDKAQAKLKAAREFRGRKETIQNGVEVVPETGITSGQSPKDPFQNGGELGPKTDVSGKESVEMAHHELVSEEKKSHATGDKGASKKKNYPETRHVPNVSKILPNTLSDEHPICVNGQPARTMCSSPLNTAFTDVDGEWKEASQYFEFVNSDSSRLAYQPHSNGDVKKETFKQEDNNDSDSAEESYVVQTNRRKLKPTKAVSRQGYYEKMVKVAQEVHDTATSEHTLTKEGIQDINHEDHREHKPKLVIEPEKNESKVWDTNQAQAKYVEVIMKAEAEVKSKNVFKNRTAETRETDSSYRGLYGFIVNDPLVNMTNEAGFDKEGERIVKETCKSQENQRVAQDGFVEPSTETLEQRKNTKSREVKGKRTEVASGVVFGGEGLHTTYESKMKDRTQDLQKTKAECWSPTEAFEDRVVKERLERTCKGQENFKTAEFQQIHELDEHLGKATNGQEPEIIEDQDVELEKCWEYLETLEQEKCRLNLDEAPNLVEKNISVESQEKNEKEEKLEQMAENGNVQSKFKLARELGERAFIDEKTDFKEYRNGAFRSHMETEGEDEDWEIDSSSDIELSINDKHQKLSNAVNLNKKGVELNAVPCMAETPHMKANGSLKVSSQKENGGIDTKVLDDIKMTGFKTSDVQIDAKELRCTLPQVSPSDEVLEGKADPAPFPHIKAYDSLESSAKKENGEINAVMSEEIRSKTFNTNDVTDNIQTVFPASQECHSDDERESRPVHASPTRQMNEKYSKSGEVCAKDDQILMKESRKVARGVSDPKAEKAAGLERGGMVRNQVVGPDLYGEEENTRPEQPQRMNGLNEISNKRLGAHYVMPDRKPSTQRAPQISSLSRNTERNGKVIYPNGSLEEKDEDNKQDLEKEHLRKLEEEREREREREKDKMAVEVAIHEARERAYADARDRAERAALERATEEVRQKTTEARERLEKACQEARERSFTDKTSEARLRAERAAVERATAEARQRAFEKTMTDRAMLESRERVQRSVSEKYTSERDVIMRQSSFPSTSERFETANGEPAERCKARLERHRRTVERVAKALEEKNIRDLLAQREQAERNRFAETLDADIKRWSSGKTGNLRALLSTLQYILGPDSGWQPIPLTDVITAAAVKKAYRKATLCVHPDKLQQRGASIQQKYISEKVFDLLKEAWNRFNSEEK